MNYGFKLVLKAAFLNLEMSFSLIIIAIYHNSHILHVVRNVDRKNKTKAHLTVIRSEFHCKIHLLVVCIGMRQNSSFLFPLKWNWLFLVFLLKYQKKSRQIGGDPIICYI